jgi:CheY-like chemotaxis protein
MPTSEKTILVVDDDPPIRVMIEALLSDSGFSIVTVPDGATALARIEADPPDVLILDYAMPRMSGREVLRELRARNSRLPVIVLSASPYAQNCLAEGANFLVQKPFDLEVLLLCIERCLALRPATTPAPGG